MGNELRIGMVGLDTSHCEMFTELLHDHLHPYHVAGGKIVAAYPGGSPDFELSASRVGGITSTLCDQYGINIVASIEAVAQQSDAILLTTVDGRIHLEQFALLAPFGKPVFIDKPFATSYLDALKLIEIAQIHQVPLMSCSSLRFAEGIVNAIMKSGEDPITGAYCYGPMPLESALPGLFWYGIHSVEMLFTILGHECLSVTAVKNDEFEVITGQWADGRTGVIRGDRTWNKTFGALLHHREHASFVDVQATPKPYYASLLEHILAFFKTGVSPVPLDETLAIMRFLEAANESRLRGGTVRL
ncbi:Gfo/Idh/MocA family protein [Brevibacillus reuszeri]|uniref:Gfo/Idh/MocA family protein n=1 Tax=Brevibacillus reuszeri TaxID=54915 RepID=UPI000CCBF964|nr:Gfo/Idh/MocA family oxidoreductase [Brevibacillus reuszeri]